MLHNEGEAVRHVQQSLLIVQQQQQQQHQNCYNRYLCHETTGNHIKIDFKVQTSLRERKEVV